MSCRYLAVRTDRNGRCAITDGVRCTNRSEVAWLTGLRSPANTPSAPGSIGSNCESSTVHCEFSPAKTTLADALWTFIPFFTGTGCAGTYLRVIHFSSAGHSGPAPKPQKQNHFFFCFFFFGFFLFFFFTNLGNLLSVAQTVTSCSWATQPSPAPNPSTCCAVARFVSIDSGP